ncbi:MAG: ribosomal protein S18-alanine N-acetyltransferase [Aquificae bacterium]|nr:ribosomal protein S18-alanine N-acetyltransferase [Aquificota bacterium]
MEKESRTNNIYIARHRKMNFVIENFSEKYFKQVKQIICSNFQNPWKDSNILFKAENSIKKVVVEINSCKVLGYIDGYTLLNEADLLLIVVRKEYQNRGIGSALLKYFLDHIKQKNIQRVYLEVSEKNQTAINLYKKFGFEIYGRRENYYGNGEDAILMKLELNGLEKNADKR